MLDMIQSITILNGWKKKYLDIFLPESFRPYIHTYDISNIALTLLENIDTVTLYVGPDNQPQWFDYILSLNPKRIIFNPGAENYELKTLASTNGIKAMEACTLVLLSTGQY